MKNLLEIKNFLTKRKDRNFFKLQSFGAEDEIRTRDVHLGKVTLYH